MLGCRDGREDRLVWVTPARQPEAERAVLLRVWLGQEDVDHIGATTARNVT